MSVVANVKNALSGKGKQEKSKLAEQVLKAGFKYDRQFTIRKDPGKNRPYIEENLQRELQLIVQEHLAKSAWKELEQAIEDLKKAEKNKIVTGEGLVKYHQCFKNVQELRKNLQDLLEKTPLSIREIGGFEEKTKESIEFLNRKISEIPDAVIDLNIAKLKKGEVVKNFSEALAKLPQVGSVFKSALKTDDILAKFKQELVAGENFDGTKGLIKARVGPKVNTQDLDNILEAALKPEAASGVKPGPEQKSGEPSSTPAPVKQAPASGVKKEEVIKAGPTRKTGDLRQDLANAYKVNAAQVTKTSENNYEIDCGNGRKASVSCGAEETLVVVPKPPTTEDMDKSLDALKAIGLSDNIDIARLVPEQQAMAQVSASMKGMTCCGGAFTREQLEKACKQRTDLPVADKEKIMQQFDASAAQIKEGRAAAREQNSKHGPVDNTLATSTAADAVQTLGSGPGQGHGFGGGSGGGGAGSGFDFLP